MRSFDFIRRFAPHYAQDDIWNGIPAAYQAIQYEPRSLLRRCLALLFEPALGKAGCNAGLDTPVLVNKAQCHQSGDGWRVVPEFRIFSYRI